MRLALCLFGQIRDLHGGYDEYFNSILKKYDVDVFAHLWQDDGEVEEFYRLYKPISSLIEEQVPFDMNRYQGAYGVELQHSIAHQYAFNSLSQAYSFNQVCKLRRDYEKAHKIKYDACIKGRLDTHISQFNIDNHQLQDNTYYVPSSPYGYIYNDVMAIATGDVMDIVASKYDKFDEWYSTGDLNFIPEYTTHKILSEHNIPITQHPELFCDLYRTKGTR